jgi:tetratricopeptide (TPR) repeat protein
MLRQRSANTTGHRLWPLLVVVFLVTACGGVRSVEKLHTEALQQAVAGEWKTLDLDEGHVDSLLLHGLALHLIGRTDDAIPPLARAAEIAPDRFSAQLFYGWILWEHGDSTDALLPLEKAVSLRPDDPNALVLASRCCLRANLDRGKQYLTSLRDTVPGFDTKPETHNAIAYLWLFDQPQVARMHLLRALKNQPRHPVILQNLAVLYDQYLNDPAEAVRYYETCAAVARSRGDRERAERVEQRLQTLRSLTP